MLVHLLLVKLTPAPVDASSVLRFITTSKKLEGFVILDRIWRGERVDFERVCFS